MTSAVMEVARFNKNKKRMDVLYKNTTKILQDISDQGLHSSSYNAHCSDRVDFLMEVPCDVASVLEKFTLIKQVFLIGGCSTSKLNVVNSLFAQTKLSISPDDDIALHVCFGSHDSLSLLPSGYDNLERRSSLSSHQHSVTFQTNDLVDVSKCLRSWNANASQPIPNVFFQTSQCELIKESSTELFLLPNHFPTASLRQIAQERACVLIWCYDANQDTSIIDFIKEQLPFIPVLFVHDENDELPSQLTTFPVSSTPLKNPHLYPGVVDNPIGPRTYEWKSCDSNSSTSSDFTQVFTKLIKTYFTAICVRMINLLSDIQSNTLLNFMHKANIMARNSQIQPKRLNFVKDCELRFYNEWIGYVRQPDSCLHAELLDIVSTAKPHCLAVVSKIPIDKWVTSRDDTQRYKDMERVKKYIHHKCIKQLNMEITRRLRHFIAKLRASSVETLQRTLLLLERDSSIGRTLGSISKSCSKGSLSAKSHLQMRASQIVSPGSTASLPSTLQRQRPGARKNFGGRAKLPARTSLLNLQTEASTKVVWQVGIEDDVASEGRTESPIDERGVLEREVDALTTFGFYDSCDDLLVHSGHSSRHVRPLNTESLMLNAVTKLIQATYNIELSTDSGRSLFDRLLDKLRSFMPMSKSEASGLSKSLRSSSTLYHNSTSSFGSFERSNGTPNSRKSQLFLKFFTRFDDASPAKELQPMITTTGKPSNGGTNALLASTTSTGTTAASSSPGGGIVSPRIEDSSDEYAVFGVKWREAIAAQLLDKIEDDLLIKEILLYIEKNLVDAHAGFLKRFEDFQVTIEQRMRQLEDGRQRLRRMLLPKVSRLNMETWALHDKLMYGAPRLEREIGRGQYGVVYACSQWGPHSKVAVKSVVPPDDKHWSDLALELLHTRQLPKENSERIVRLLGLVIDYQYNPEAGMYAALLISERMERDLHSALKLRLLSWPTQLLRVSIDVAEGIRYLHTNGLMHRDIKLKNVLLDVNDRAKLADLGFAKPVSLIDGSLVGTPIHMAPEIFSGGYSFAVDIYAFGVLYWYICSRDVKLSRNFDRCQHKEMLWSAVEKGVRPERLDIIDDDSWALMSRCWRQAPDDRPHISEVIIDLRAILAKQQGTAVYC